MSFSLPIHLSEEKRICYHSAHLEEERFQVIINNESVRRGDGVYFGCRLGSAEDLSWREWDRTNNSRAQRAPFVSSF